MGCDGAGDSQNLAALDVFFLDTTEQAADVVAGLALFEQLAEHFNAGNRRLLGFLDTNDLDFLTDLDDTAFDTAGNDRTTTFDGEDVFDRHQEGLVNRALGRRDVVVNGVHQFADALAFFAVPILASGEGFTSLQGGTVDDRNFIAGEFVGAQELADFHVNLSWFTPLLRIWHPDGCPDSLCYSTSKTADRCLWRPPDVHGESSSRPRSRSQPTPRR